MISDRLKRNEVMSSEEIKEFMQLHGISKSELAEILGVTDTAVTYWLTGKREFSVLNSRLIRLFKKYPQIIKKF